MQIEAVVFDIGNVLIEWNPERYYDRILGKERRQQLFREVDLEGMNEAVDLGAPFRETVYAKAEEAPDWSSEIRLWHDNWIELAKPDIPHSIRLLRKLRAKNVPVFALSNFGIGTFDYAVTQYPVLDEFDRRYISGHLEVIKPDPRIYEILEEDCGIAPERLIFTDDRAENIAMAASRGWQTHLFKGPQGWADRLVAQGLLTEAEAA
ncbi:HAD family phosphatase [Thalassococcus sp. S3]|uniref:HAD family hydrolase n=1 Tax=Thalassococcus sp. S3 TaxID=2017482 RepID=UPI0010248C81|nr:HAD family phosphatase [Thalassococcus sp. S3]QBF29863.1 haloacid dehalogenase [Thalassococcus sp. S3]